VLPENVKRDLPLAVAQIRDSGLEVPMITTGILDAVVEGPETWPMVLEVLAPWINTIGIKDFTWDCEDRSRLLNVPLGQGLVPLDEFLKMLNVLEIHKDFSIHCEYPLGGAEKGNTMLTISREAFTQQVGADFDHLNAILAN